MNSTQQMHNTIIRRITGGLSMLGAGYIIYEICSTKAKQRKPYFRLLLGMMMIEFSDGLAFFLGSWFVPRGTWWGAAGNDTTCNVQGFQMSLMIGSGIYNAGLALYYLLLIRYEWSERCFQRRVELWVHIISLGWSIGVATAGYFLDLYTSIGMVCYISRTPKNCKQTYEYGYTTCEQGDNATLYNLIFYRVVNWFAFCFTAVCMILVFLSVRRQENIMASYSFDRSSSSSAVTSPINRQYSKRFATQGALYVAVFYLGHFFTTINMAHYQTTGQWSYPLLMLSGVFLPFEGFLNCLVYLRPRVLKYLEERREKKTSCLPPIAPDTTKDIKEDNNNDEQNTNKQSEDDNGSARCIDDDVAYVFARSREIRVRIEEEEDITLGAY